MPRAQWLSRTFSNATLVAYRQGVGPTFLRAKRVTVKSLPLPNLSYLAIATDHANDQPCSARRSHGRTMNSSQAPIAASTQLTLSHSQRSLPLPGLATLTTPVPVQPPQQNVYDLSAIPKRPRSCCRPRGLLPPDPDDLPTSVLMHLMHLMQPTSGV